MQPCPTPAPDRASPRALHALLEQGFALPRRPIGVGARDLQECLLVELRQLKVENSLPEVIIKKHLKNLESKNLPAIAKDLKVPLEAVIDAVKVISNLDPMCNHFRP